MRLFFSCRVCVCVCVEIEAGNTRAGVFDLRLVDICFFKGL